MPKFKANNNKQQGDKNGHNRIHNKQHTNRRGTHHPRTGKTPASHHQPRQPPVKTRARQNAQHRQSLINSPTVLPLDSEHKGLNYAQVQSDPQQTTRQSPCKSSQKKITNGLPSPLTP